MPQSYPLRLNVLQGLLNNSVFHKQIECCIEDNTDDLEMAVKSEDVQMDTHPRSKAINGMPAFYFSRRIEVYSSFAKGARGNYCGCCVGKP